MSREIKFRVWDSYDKKFLDYGEVDIWDLIFEEPKLMEEIYTDGMANECLEFLQYTGLKDKNGVEIYEFMELDNKYKVIYIAPKYVLQDISSGDITDLYENKYTVTKEYTEV